MRLFRMIRPIFAASLASLALFIAPASAQLSPYPLYRNLDENGVDLVRGDFMLSLKEGSIGSGDAELNLIRTNGIQSVHQWDKYTFARTVSGSSATIRIGMPGGFYDEFAGTTGGSTFTTVKANGAILTGSDGNYSYTAPDGTRITFIDLSRSWEIGFASNFCSSLTRLSSCILAANRITSPNGIRVTFGWDTFNPTNTYYDSRIASVSNNAGYSITFAYLTNTWVAPGGTWHIRSGADFRNTAISPNVQASVAYAYPNGTTLDFTDMAGNAWQIVQSGTQSSIRRPGEASPYFTINGSSGVSSVTKDGVVTTYNRSVVGNIVTMTKTNPLAQATVITSDLTKGQPTSIKDALNRTTSYTYDTSNRLKRVTRPEGNYIEYTLDARGNATQTQQVAKPGSGLATLTASAVYPATCTNVLTCNKPTSSTDARGKVTDYVWDATHGGITSITKPAPTVGAVRPQARYTYTQFGTGPAKYYLLTGVSECQTTASCSATADEVKTTIGYDSNANATTVSAGNGTGTLTATKTMTYDAIGNLLSVDGPLAGTADTTRFKYDAARRQTGSVDPDPDDTGSAYKYRGIRTTYDVSGRPTKRELGTLNPAGAPPAPDWTTFASQQTVDIAYVSGRVSTQKLSSGATNYALMQLSYDAAGRPECSAIRMNRTAYGSLPASACTLGTEGADGKDRISKTVYDAAGEVIESRLAVGTTDEAVERTLTYTSNGNLQTLKDAENNLTTYEYDGHDRLSKTRYPVPTPKGANASSTTDFEVLSYDANGNITQRQLRAPSSPPVINFTYDALNRVTLKDLPASEPDVTYVYDNLNRMTSASQTGTSLTFTYDALSRNLTQAGPQGTICSAWDLAGRRTRLVYAGTCTSPTFYMDYDYLVTGEMTKVRENGATSGVGVLATYAYDNLRRRTSLTFGNGVVQNFTFDPVSRLASLSNELTGTTNDLSATFAYNPASQIASNVRTGDAYPWTGHYNQNVTGTPNGLNQLTAYGSKSLTHDPRGNVTAFGSKSFTYSSENLLLTGPNSTTLSYDPMMRLQQVVSGTTTKFAYDGAVRIIEFDGAGAVLRRYVHGPGVDNQIVWYEGSGTTDRRFLSADERGSIISVTNSTGGLVGAGINKYDEYGQPLSTNVGSWGYTGQAWLPTMGVWYYKARIYEPELGRFLQTDPVGYANSPNPYAYVFGDPVSFADPLGMTCGYTIGSRIRRCDDGTGGSIDTGVVMGGGFGPHPNNQQDTDAGGGIGSRTPTEDRIDACLHGSAEACYTPAGLLTPGTHDYPVGPTLVCVTAYSGCLDTAIGRLPYFAVPGSSGPVESGGTYAVHDPFNNYLGTVFVVISNGGMDITNYALPLHGVCCGRIEHSLYEQSGAVYIYTHGSGGNRSTFNAWINDVFGPMLFRSVHRDFILDVRARLHPWPT